MHNSHGNSCSNLAVNIIDWKNSSKWEQVLESTVLNNMDSECAHAKSPRYEDI